MASEIFLRDDLSIFVVAGAPRGFDKELTNLVRESAEESGEVRRVKDEMADWLLAKLKEDDRRSFERTPASAALWRAYRALSAARYHLKDDTMEEQVRAIRSEIEKLWTTVSPMHRVDHPAQAV